MGKRARTKARLAVENSPDLAITDPDDAAEVGPRQPCPCGSGARYKNCHGGVSGPAATRVARPFAGLASEADLVALRELVPAATAPVRFLDSAEIDREVLICTLLPMAAPALVRQDGTVMVGLQVQHGFGDPSRELVAVLERALTSEPGLVGLTEAPGPGRRLQDILSPEPLEITVHDGFDFWLADPEDADPAARASLEQANTVASPTVRLPVVEAAYWTQVGAKEHVRWAMGEEEDALLDAFARLHVAEQDGLGGAGRLVGMFRAHGLLVPVWDLPLGTGAQTVEEPVQALRTLLDEALGSTAPVTSAERSARHGLANRQVTIR